VLKQYRVVQPVSPCGFSHIYEPGYRTGIKTGTRISGQEMKSCLVIIDFRKYGIVTCMNQITSVWIHVDHRTEFAT